MELYMSQHLSSTEFSLSQTNNVTGVAGPVLLMMMMRMTKYMLGRPLLIVGNCELDDDFRRFRLCLYHVVVYPARLNRAI